VVRRDDPDIIAFNVGREQDTKRFRAVSREDQ
jgi:hypothetical protein